MPLLPAVNRVSSWQAISNTGLISNSDLLNNVKLTTANKLTTRIGGKSCNVYQKQQSSIVQWLQKPKQNRTR